MAIIKSLLRLCLKYWIEMKLAKLYLVRLLLGGVAISIVFFIAKYVVEFCRDTVGGIWEKGWAYLLESHPVLLLFMGAGCICGTFANSPWKGYSQASQFLLRPVSFLMGLLMILLWTRMS